MGNPAMEGDAQNPYVSCQRKSSVTRGKKEDLPWEINLSTRWTGRSQQNHSTEESMETYRREGGIVKQGIYLTNCKSHAESRKIP